MQTANTFRRIVQILVHFLASAPTHWLGIHRVKMWTKPAMLIQPLATIGAAISGEGVFNGEAKGITKLVGIPTCYMTLKASDTTSFWPARNPHDCTTNPGWIINTSHEYDIRKLWLLSMGWVKQKPLSLKFDHGFGFMHSYSVWTSRMSNNEKSGA